MIIKEEFPCVDVGLRLALGLGGGGGGSIPSGGGGIINKKRPRQPQQAAPVQFHLLFPSRPKKEREDGHDDDDKACVHAAGGGGLSGLSLSVTPVTAEDEEDSVDKDPRPEDRGGTRKKLRLSKEQSALLEESFRRQSTLNPAQKQELAQRLNLRARQVEVWFQNRRARTKLKQTEVDCELLKKWCESLTNENTQLKREVQELRTMRTGNHPFFLQLHKPAAAAGSPTAALCPSCERITTTPDGGSSSSSSKGLSVVGGGAAASSPDSYRYAAAIKDTSSVACRK